MFGRQRIRAHGRVLPLPHPLPYSREKQRILFTIDVEKSDCGIGTMCASMHPSRSGLRDGWIRATAKGASIHAARTYPDLYTDRRSGLSTCWPRSSTFLATSTRTATPSARPGGAERQKSGAKPVRARGHTPGSLFGVVRWAALLLPGFLIAFGATARAQPYTTWREYGGGGFDAVLRPRADQQDQRRAGSNRPGSSSRPGAGGSFAFNPLIVDSVMYVGGQ